MYPVLSVKLANSDNKTPSLCMSLVLNGKCELCTKWCFYSGRFGGSSSHNHCINYYFYFYFYCYCYFYNWSGVTFGICSRNTENSINQPFKRFSTRKPSNMCLEVVQISQNTMEASRFPLCWCHGASPDSLQCGKAIPILLYVLLMLPIISKRWNLYWVGSGCCQHGNRG